MEGCRAVGFQKCLVKQFGMMDEGGVAVCHNDAFI